MSSGRKRSLWKVFYILLTEKYNVKFTDEYLYDFIDSGIAHCIANNEDVDVYLEKYFNNLKKQQEILIEKVENKKENIEQNIVEVFDYPVEQKVEIKKTKTAKKRN